MGSWFHMCACAGLGGVRPEAFVTGANSGCQNHNSISMFLSLCPIMILRGGKNMSELVCFVIQILRQRTPSTCELNGASLRYIANAGVCPFMHNQPEPLPRPIASILWVNGVWHRKGAVKGANLSLKWTFYRNPIFSGAQSQTDLVD